MKNLFLMLKCAAMAAAIASVILLALFPIVSDDLFLYLQTGKIMQETGTVPKSFGFTFTLPDYEMEMMGEWLSCVFFHVVHDAFCWDGLILFKTALVALFAVAALMILRLNGRYPPGAAVLIAAGAYAAADRFIERSSLFSDVLFCLLLVLLLALSRSLKRHSRRCFLYIPVFFCLFLLWGNVHTGYWPALAAIFCFFAGDLLEGVIDRLRQGRAAGITFFAALKSEISRLWIWIACGAGSFAACFLNPYFHETVFFPFKIKQDAEELSAFYGEYMPTFSVQNFRVAWQLQTFLAIVAVFVFLAVIRWRRKPIKEVLTAGLLVYSSTLFVRFLAFASLGVTLLCVHLLSMKPRHQPSSRDAAGWRGGLAYTAIATELLACLIFAMTLGAGGYKSISGTRKPGLGLDRNLQPVAAADFIEKHDLQSIRFFNQHEAGAYLVWRFDGAMKVFFHGWVTDNDFYFNEYFAANKSPAEFNRIVEKYDIEAFLLTRPPPIDPKMLPPLYLGLYVDFSGGQPNFSGPGSSAWRLVWWDNRYMLYLKDIPRFASIIRSEWYKYADPAMTHFYFQGLRDDRARTLAEKERAQVAFRGLVLPPVWENR